jgi:hypothetical protein
VGKNKAFTCQNPNCKKTFTTPLKTLNLQQKPTEPYFSCPYCLTQIENEQTQEKEEKLEETVTQTENDQVERAKSSVTPAACQYHLGYLNERSSKEQFPDDCLVCKDIVECMQKKTRA